MTYSYIKMANDRNETGRCKSEALEPILGKDQLNIAFTFATIELISFFSDLLVTLCFYLAKSYSLAGERAEAYLLFTRALSLADNAVKELKGMANLDQEMMEELSVLSRSCRSSICIEHATGIMEKKELEDPEKLSKNFCKSTSMPQEKLLIEKLDVYEPAIGASNTKAAPSIEAFPPRNPCLQHD
ncbi:hypothetical protein V2J09_011886 [Rumex salicifolius]